jgi:hypothetical protein
MFVDHSEWVFLEPLNNHQRLGGGYVPAGVVLLQQSAVSLGAGCGKGALRLCSCNYLPCNDKLELL